MYFKHFIVTALIVKVIKLVDSTKIGDHVVDG